MIGGAFALLALTVVLLGPGLRREFFPEVDSGAFEMTVRLPSGTRIEMTSSGSTTRSTSSTWTAPRRRRSG